MPRRANAAGGASARRATPEALHLIPIGHVEVAMPSNIVYESVHCGYCWLTDQSQGCLIQVHTLTEAGIIQSIKRRGDHYR